MVKKYAFKRGQVVTFTTENKGFVVGKIAGFNPVLSYNVMEPDGTMWLCDEEDLIPVVDTATSYEPAMKSSTSIDFEKVKAYAETRSIMEKFRNDVPTRLFNIVNRYKYRTEWDLILLALDENRFVLRGYGKKIDEYLQSWLDWNYTGWRTFADAQPTETARASAGRGSQGTGGRAAERIGTERPDGVRSGPADRREGTERRLEMIDREKVIRGLESCLRLCEFNACRECPYGDGTPCKLLHDALVLLKEQEKENRALRKLLDWAVECDWGLDNLGDWWVERFSDEIKGMGYTESLIHLARRYIEIFEGDKDDAE